MMIIFIFVAGALRVLSVAISSRNERRLRQAGAVEHAPVTTRVLAGAHVAFYLAAIAEWYLRGLSPSWLTWLGLVIYVFSMLALVYVVRTLGRFWTVKIMIARDHELVTSRLFRALRHPNYFLNIIPELIGFALVLQAFATLVIGLPVYCVILFLRIRQEEQAMRGQFPDY